MVGPSFMGRFAEDSLEAATIALMIMVMVRMMIMLEHPIENGT